MSISAATSLVAACAVGPLVLREGRAGIDADRDGAVFGFWEGSALTWSVGQSPGAAGPPDP
ncbi:hypothetical protein ACFCZY_32595 [Streptomyces sp. NPDC056237]|uniref:hypothetical protein n=1 Tax=unclassified Streptomyces TaxID=2593676 RepID=UPI0035E06FAF